MSSTIRYPTLLMRKVIQIKIRQFFLQTLNHIGKCWQCLHWWGFREGAFLCAIGRNWVQPYQRAGFISIWNVYYTIIWASPVAQTVKNPPARDAGSIPGSGRSKRRASLDACEEQYRAGVTDVGSEARGRCVQVSAFPFTTRGVLWDVLWGWVLQFLHPWMWGDRQGANVPPPRTVVRSQFV